MCISKPLFSFLFQKPSGSKQGENSHLEKNGRHISKEDYVHSPCGPLRGPGYARLHRQRSLDNYYDESKIVYFTQTMPTALSDV